MTPMSHKIQCLISFPITMIDGKKLKTFEIFNQNQSPESESPMRPSNTAE